MRASLEQPRERRRAEFLAAVARSRKLHGRWISAPATGREFGRYLTRIAQPTHAGYWVVTETNELAGVITVSEIVRGSFRSGYLGYYALVPFHRKGYMTLGLRAVINRAFGALRLHRLEANVQPANTASRRLVRRLGFRKEGVSRKYLKIAGRWRDHERWALTVEDWRASRARSPHS
jgi:ribosomal-protein-alanine N-acetyltransferase